MLLESAFHYLFYLKFSFKMVTFSKSYARKHKWMFFFLNAVYIHSAICWWRPGQRRLRHKASFPGSDRVPGRREAITWSFAGTLQPRREPQWRRRSCLPDGVRAQDAARRHSVPALQAIARPVQQGISSAARDVCQRATTSRPYHQWWRFVNSVCIIQGQFQEGGQGVRGPH